MNKNLTMADLNVGYVVKTRAHGLYMVTRNDIDQLVMVDQHHGYMPLYEYNDDNTYGAIETKINEFLKTIPAEKVVDIRVTETDGKFTVTVVYETETRDEIQMSNSQR